MTRPIDPRTRITASVAGSVAELDRVYVLDELGKLFASSTREVCRAHARLFADPDTHARPVAIAVCVIATGDKKIVIAGALGDTVGRAVDDLMVRLRPGFRGPGGPAPMSTHTPARRSNADHG
jgi:hypothetical protein